jgi:hypothetical protein
LICAWLSPHRGKCSPGSEGRLDPHMSFSLGETIEV